MVDETEFEIMDADHENRLNDEFLDFEEDHCDPEEPDPQQIVYALSRQIESLETRSREMPKARDHDVMFFEKDAKQLAYAKDFLLKIFPELKAQG